MQEQQSQSPEAAIDQRPEWALEEYRQLCEYDRQAQRTRWSVLGLAAATSAVITAIAVASLAADSWRLVLLAPLVAALWSLACWVFFDIDRENGTRRERARELEASLGMDNLRRYERAKPRKLGTTTAVVVSLAAVWLVVVAVVIAVVVQRV